MIFLWGILVFLFGLGNITTPLWAKTGKASPKARLIQIDDQVFPGRLRVILKTSRPVVSSILYHDRSSSLGCRLKPLCFD